MIEVSLFIALAAGLVSFLSPCVLPIVPGFLSYLAGVSSSDTETSESKKRWAIFLNSVFFVLGFTVVFAVLGVILNTVLEAVAFDAQIWLARIGGALVIFFGLYLMKLIRIPFLERDHKIAVRRKFGSRYVTSFVFGSAFAAGWTPCVGPILGTILTLAATVPSVSFSLLLAYSAGLGIPFILMGVFFSKATKIISSMRKHLKYYNWIIGGLIIILGILIFTNQLAYIANFPLLNELVMLG